MRTDPCSVPDESVGSATRGIAIFHRNVICGCDEEGMADLRTPVSPHGPLTGLVAVKRATVNLDALYAAWPPM